MVCFRYVIVNTLHKGDDKDDDDDDDDDDDNNNNNNNNDNNNKAFKWNNNTSRAVYTVPVTVFATGVFAHTLHYVLKRLDVPDLLYLTIQRPVIFVTFDIESS